MQALITLDFGNTHPNAAVFQKVDGEWHFLKQVLFSELALVTNALGLSAHNCSLVLSEVKPYDELLQPWLEQGYLLTRVKDYWRGSKFAGMPVNYANSLGEDRLVAAYYAYKKEKLPVLILDSGTFLTMDVVTSSGFLGGYIVPGSASYFTLFEQAHQLQNLNLGPSVSRDLPSATEEAINQGYAAFGAMAKEIIHEYSLSKILLTGGEAPYWSNYFATQNMTSVVEMRPHLIHSALHYWMTTQIEPL